MAYQVLINGAMIEVVLGHDPKTGREKTASRILREGALIKEELSESMRTRYDEGDEYVRSLVQRGSIVTGENDQKFLEPESDSEALGDVAEGVSDVEVKKALDAAAARIESLEKEVEQVKAAHESDRGQFDVYSEDKAKQVEALEAKVSELEGQLDQATAPDPTAIAIADLSKDALVAQAAAEDVAVTRGDGKEGDPTKPDYVKALTEARSAP